MLIRNLNVHGIERVTIGPHVTVESTTWREITVRDTEGAAFTLHVFARNGVPITVDVQDEPVNAELET
jgi:hypothetical protein